MSEESKVEVELPELKIPTERKKVTLPTNMLLSISELISETQAYSSYSDFVTTACNYVIELDSAQESLLILEEMAEKLKHSEDTIRKKPFDIDYKIEKLSGPTGSVFITFPAGLVQQLNELAVRKRIKPTNLVRYCIQFYYQQINDRIKTEKGVNNMLAEALQAVIRSQILETANKVGWQDD